MTDKSDHSAKFAEALNKAIMFKQAEFFRETEKQAGISPEEMARRLNADFDDYILWRAGNEPNPDWVQTALDRMLRELS